jgi:hypothetical protein
VLLLGQVLTGHCLAVVGVDDRFTFDDDLNARDGHRGRHVLGDDLLAVIAVSGSWCGALFSAFLSNGIREDVAVPLAMARHQRDVAAEDAGIHRGPCGLVRPLST